MMQQISANQQLTLMLMSLMGDCPTPWPINDEIGNVGEVQPPLGALFRFLRYDIELEEEWLRKVVEISVDADTLRQARRLDDAGSMLFLEEIGRRAARLQVLPEHWTD